MKILSVVVLLALASLCVAKGHYRKIEKKFMIPRIVRPNIRTRFDKNKMAAIEKLKKVKSMEDFLRVFKVPYVKKKRTRQPSALKPSVLKPVGQKTDSSVQSIAPQYDLFLTKQSASQSVFGEAKSMLQTGSVASSPSIQLSAENLECKPRPTIHSLPASYYHLTFPSCFTLNQCSGCCNSKVGFICRPTELSIKTEMYMKFNYRSNAVTSATIQLAHHKACECRCKLDAKDCLPTQRFDPDLCSCLCNGQQKPCPYTQTWSNNECRCVCKGGSQSCFTGKEWNEDTCSCQCKKVPCSLGSIQDTSTCYCVKVA